MKARITKIKTDGQMFSIDTVLIDKTGGGLNWEQLGGKLIFDPAEFGGQWTAACRSCKLSVGDIITDGLEPELCGVKTEAGNFNWGADYYHARALNAEQAADKFDALRRRGV